MKDTVWLVFNRSGVVKMTKREPDLERGQYPLKLNIIVENSAFRQPILEVPVMVSDWRQGIDAGDVDLREGTITEAEAQMIRDRRLAELVTVLADKGYKIEAPAPPEAEIAREEEL